MKNTPNPKPQAREAERKGRSLIFGKDGLVISVGPSAPKELTDWMRKRLGESPRERRRRIHDESIDMKSCKVLSTLEAAWDAGCCPRCFLVLAEQLELQPARLGALGDLVWSESDIEQVHNLMQERKRNATEEES